MHVVNIFSLSVSAATLPKPTLVMHVMVKYNAVTYIVLRAGPLTSSGMLLFIISQQLCNEREKQIEGQVKTFI